MKLLEDPATGTQSLVADDEVDFYPGWEEAAVGACEALQLTLAKDAKRANINQLRDMKQAEPAMTAVGLVDADERSKTNINGLVSMAQLAKASGQPFAVQFTLADNQRHPLDADGMIGVGLAVGRHVIARHDCAAALKATLDACGTIEAVDAIDIEANWP